MRLADRMNRLGTETAFEVLARAKALEAQGKNIIHLQIGEPDFDTPKHISEAAKQALDDGFTHYGPSAGQADLREVIANHMKSTRGIDVDTSRIVVTPGAKPILFYTIMALAQRGDEVIYTDPGFPIYRSMIEFCGATPVPLTFNVVNDRFVMDLDDLATKISDRTKMVILNFPQNPTGATVTGSELERLADLLRDTDAVIFSDEVYSEIIYEGTHSSIYTVSGFEDRTVLLDGFSKTFAMTGWRLGYGILPEPLVDGIVKLVTNSVSCAPTFVQKAAISALTGPQDDVQEMVKQFSSRRELIVSGLRNIPGITCAMPGGAFYVFPNIEGTGLNSDEFADKSLYEAGVAVVSGNSFGVCGEGFVRLSYANSEDNITEALNRIDTLVRKNK